MSTILFLGTYLSKQTGTKGVMEKIAEGIDHHRGAQMKLISTIRNPIIRAFHTISVVLFSDYSAAHLDLFSGRSFHVSAFLGYLLHMRKKPFLITMRGGRLAEFYAENVVKMNLLLTRATRVQTPSRFLQAFFNGKGFEVAYLPNPIQLDIFKPSNPAITRKPFSLLWVRAFEKIYHPALAVEVLNLLLPDYPEATLTMIGPDKGLLNDVRQQISALGVEQKVNIAGPVPNEQLPAYYHSHAVFLNTTDYESFGVAVVEAAACSIPIVSSSVGEIPYLWKQGEDMLMSEKMDAAEFAAAVQRIFEDPALAQKLTQNARKKAEIFDFKQLIQKWEILLTNLKSEAKRLRPLFIGNFLSEKRGTIGPTEHLIRYLAKEGMSISSTSNYEPKILRALDILKATTCRNCNLICVDVFSGNVLNLLPLVCFIAYLRRIPLVLVLHGGQLPEVYQNYPSIFKKVFGSAKRIVTPSLDLKSFFEGQGFKVHYVPNSIRIEDFPYVPHQILNSTPKLLWVRAFADIYNPNLAVDALVELRKTHPFATMTMVGPDAGNLVQTRIYIAQKGIQDAIEITGSVPNEQLSRYHQTHTVFLNTTSYESFGIAVLEAAASGIPIVSSAVGSIPLLWNDEQELLMAEVLEPVVFAQKIRRICDEPGLAGKLSLSARSKAETFTINTISPQWHTLFNGVLEQ